MSPSPRPTLRLTLAEASAIRAEVFDVQGRRVGVLHDGPLAAGPHPLGVDTGRWSPGVYLVRVTAEAGAAASQTLVIVR